LDNFRCHEGYFLECLSETAMISGENGSGKTSILEAIFEVLQGKSFRAVDREMIRRGAEFYRIEAEYVNGERVVVVYMAKREKKEFLVGGKKTARLPKKYKYPVVLFEPSDLNLVSASPGRRREYFDRFLGQMSEKYNDSLSKYNKALKQRNELLKTEITDFSMAFSWNVMLARLGVEIEGFRREMVERVNRRLTEVYRSIAENEDEVFIRLAGDFSGEINESGYLRELEARFLRDKVLGHTSFGVHRDDYEFLFNGRGADGSASRGEIRSTIIALKFIEARELYEKLRKQPVVLLDDVFSELDEARQRALVKNFKENQVFITSVGAVEV